MLEHYRDIGITSYQLHVHMKSPEDPILSEVRAITDRMGVNIASVQTGQIWFNFQTDLLWNLLPSCPNDWFIIADQDEFQVYPSDLFEVLETCESNGYDHILGCFVDRLGPDGTLPELSPDLPLWSQFPLGSFVTYPILTGSPVKVVAAKGTVGLLGGAHWVTNQSSPCPLDLYHIPVHHFKWTTGIVEHLRDRADLVRTVDAHWNESRRAVNYLERNDGKFDISDPRLMVAMCDPDYPRWNDVTGMMLNWQRTGKMFPFEELPYPLHNVALPARYSAAADPPISPIFGNSNGAVCHTWENIDLSDICNPMPEQVYRSNRTGDISFAFSGLEPNTPYILRLHFAEVENMKPGGRLFHVAVNGKLVLKSLDIAYEAGNNRAIVKSVPTIADRWGFITADFASERGAAIVSGIEILASDQVRKDARIAS